MITNFLSRNRYNKKILFVSSTITSPETEIDTYDYFAAIASELAINLQKRHTDYDLVLKVPDISTAPKDQQVRFISNAIKYPDNYECIIVSPVDRGDLYNMMKRWIESYGNNKIILVDQGFTLDDYPTFHNDNVSRPPYVQANWINGGEVAAKSLHAYFQSIPIPCPNIVVIKGKVGSQQRINGFLEYFSRFNKPGVCNISVAEIEGHYSRKLAEENFEKYLISCIDSGKVIDAIFATNDDMALGVREAFNKHRDDYLEKLKHIHGGKTPKLIGFDGIKAVTMLIDMKMENEILYDTVDVRLKVQIAKLADMIEGLVISGGDHTKYVDEPCISYRELKKYGV